MLWFWIFVGPAVILGVLSLRGERKRAGYVAARMADLVEPPVQPLPPATILVPVVHSTPALSEALRSLAAQDYPDFELLIVAPGSASLEPGVLPTSAKVALVNEQARIGLVQAGVRAVRRSTEVLVFATATGRVSSLWLRALVAPLSDPLVGVSAGFRWYTPELPTFWSLMRSVWNAVIAGRFGPGAADFAWSGAMAIPKATFFAARLNECWTDLAFAARDAHLLIAFAPGAMVACSGRVTARQFLTQARREMAQARRYLPRAWWLALLAHIIYCGAMLAAVVASAKGHRGAEWALVVLFGLGMLKGANRATLAKAQLPHCKTWFDRYSWTTTFWVPLATWTWLYVLISSLLSPRPAPRSTR